VEVVVVVAMVTKNGKCSARCSRMEVTEDRGTNNGFWSAEDWCWVLRSWVDMLKSLRPEAKNKKKDARDKLWESRASGTGQIALPSPCGEVDPKEASASKKESNPEGHCMARWSYEQRDDNAILGQDPVGPLALPGGPEPLLHLVWGKLMNKLKAPQSHPKLNIQVILWIICLIIQNCQYTMYSCQTEVTKWYIHVLWLLPLL